MQFCIKERMKSLDMFMFIVLMLSCWKHVQYRGKHFVIEKTHFPELFVSRWSLNDHVVIIKLVQVMHLMILSFLSFLMATFAEPKKYLLLNHSRIRLRIGGSYQRFSGVLRF